MRGEERGNEKKKLNSPSPYPLQRGGEGARKERKS